VYVVYSDRLDVNSDDVNIFLRYSDNNGASWSAPIQINDDSTLTSQFMPRMDVDQSTGDIYVAWYDARLDTASNRAVNIYAAVSSDGGLTFSPNIRVSQEESDVAIPGNCTF
jgi:Neuraminidase (sialidase)